MNNQRFFPTDKRTGLFSDRVMIKSKDVKTSADKFDEEMKKVKKWMILSLITIQ